ncbi:hypothetical protein QAD02_005410 [Eretmocerus hayati]|uniref:Uncharacterized protein n=1 Tax=Eretmocerus hayati TaxID=131215 RepID=A0ACC2NTH0_9HYME|nr:hypothetical protein QAD02_005410 [Eretmocerus hayati]
MRTEQDLHLFKVIDEEIATDHNQMRGEIRDDARQRIPRVQEDDGENHNKHRKQAIQYTRGDIVAIRRTQQGLGLKLAVNFLRPYRVTKCKTKYTGLQKLVSTQAR